MVHISHAAQSGLPRLDAAGCFHRMCQHGVPKNRSVPKNDSHCKAVMLISEHCTM